MEKGLRESVTKGVLAGYPMVNLKATLYFGSYHPVDSSEMAFKTAASIAYKNGIPQASPTILEPIGTLKAYMPDDNLGDIMGDITKRRGRVLGMGAADEPKMQELVAEVPLAEMGDFATVLRSVTAGRGYFALEFSRYEEAPANIVTKIIEAAEAEEEANKTRCAGADHHPLPLCIAPKEGLNMIRNNVVALCIHGVIGTVIFLVGEVYWQALSGPRVAVGLLAVYAAYFFAAFAAAKLRLFNRHKKKVRHVLLPGVVMLCCIALLIMTDFSFYSEFFGLVVGVYGQPAELLLAISGERLASPLS